MLKNNLAEDASLLLNEQKKEWDTLASGYSSLTSVEKKNLTFNIPLQEDHHSNYNITFTLQFNPKRLISTAAMTDDESIRQRKCFLCKENRPAEQKGININDYFSMPVDSSQPASDESGFILLCNPYPIFSEHFTITDVQHKPQRIKGSFIQMLEISKLLQNKYALFYNGPGCGASAPDHLHFQAGTISEFIILNEIEMLKNNCGVKLVPTDTDIVNSASMHAINDGIRKMILIEGDNISDISMLFTAFYNAYEKHSDDAEPKMNIISAYDNKWQVIIYLREKHRPGQFYAERGDKITFSPAAADCSGVCVIPVEKDYRRTDKHLLKDMLSQVFINNKTYDDIVKEFNEVPLT